MIWVAFFSQTGNEIVNLSKKLKYSPDIIITNNLRIEKLDIYKLYSSKIFKLKNTPELEDYIKLFNQLNIKLDNSIITLHGYLRIIPKQLCGYKIFNLHPSLINFYPELKGLNPQVRAINSKYPFIGCVIHEVTPEVDSGNILL
ncbi:MAG: hypothetical protein KAU90_05150, partial [Sulfurovaceae bacterium]|nr:hypothetical protein [Sulfurovaceae bacterium]